jgi:GT2 family glycosyltransferase
MTPTISVLMTIYNPGRFLAPAIETLLAQSFGDFELIAVENGSTDGSRELIRQYAARDARIKVIELERNIGRTPALFEAFAAARGEFIAVQDADDTSEPERFAKQVDYLRAHGDCVLLGTWCRMIDGDGAAIGAFHPAAAASEAFMEMCHTNVVAHSSAMYRRQAAIAAGGYPADLAYAQDYGLWVRLLRQGGVANLAEDLASIRQHGGAMSQAPDTVFVRSLDAIRVFREAASLPGLSAAALRGNRRVEALECGRLAKALMAQGQWAAALSWFAGALVRDPVSVVSKMVAQAAR